MDNTGIKSWGTGWYMKILTNNTLIHAVLFSIFRLMLQERPKYLCLLIGTDFFTIVCWCGIIKGMVMVLFVITCFLHIEISDQAWICLRKDPIYAISKRLAICLSGTKCFQVGIIWKIRRNQTFCKKHVVSGAA